MDPKAEGVYNYQSMPVGTLVEITDEKIVSVVGSILLEAVAE